MSAQALIDHILSAKRFAVSGASREPDKFGYKVYKSLKRAGYTVYAVNPNADTIDGDPCYPSLDNVPDTLDCLVTVTPPAVTEETLLLAGRLQIPFVWMQPGSESEAAYNLASGFSMRVVSGGPCIMVEISAKRKRDGKTF